MGRGHDAPLMEQWSGESDDEYIRRCALWALEQSISDGWIDRQMATDQLVGLAKSNPHLLYLLIVDALPTRCWDVVRRYLGEARRANWQQAAAEGERIMQDAIEADAPDLIEPPNASSTPLRSVKPLPSEVAPQSAPVVATTRYSGLGQSVLDTYAIEGRHDGESILLGDARRGDLLYAATRGEQRVRDNLKRALFLRQLAGRLPDDQTRVRAVVNESEVALSIAQAEAQAIALLPSA